MKTAGSGFALVEMLAALVVCALGCTVMLMAFGQAAQTLAQVRASDRLSLAARSVMEEQRDQLFTAGERRGMNGTVHWRMQIAPQPGPAGPMMLWRLDLRVHEGANTLRLSTLVVQSRPVTEALR